MRAKLLRLVLVVEALTSRNQALLWIKRAPLRYIAASREREHGETSDPEQPGGLSRGVGMIPPERVRRFNCRDCGFAWTDDDPGETPREPCPHCRSVNLELTVFDPTLIDAMW